MYPEFIAIYAGLMVLAAMMVVMLVLLIKLIKRSNVGNKAASYVSYAKDYTQNQDMSPGRNIVFCKHCATEFDAVAKVCPKCGTPR